MSHDLSHELELMSYPVLLQSTEVHAVATDVLGFLSEKKVRDLAGAPSRSTLRRWEHLGIFPRRRKLGPNRVGWLQVEVEEWLKVKAGPDQKVRS
jgi:prophage regulatory protein